MSPAWSPDGQSLAYVSFEARVPSIYVQTLKTGERRRVSAQRGVPYRIAREVPDCIGPFWCNKPADVLHYDVGFPRFVYQTASTAYPEFAVGDYPMISSE